MRKDIYSVHFFARTEKGKEYMIDHVEEVLAEGVAEAIPLGMQRLPAEIMRRPVTRAVAYRRVVRNSGEVSYAV